MCREGRLTALSLEMFERDVQGVMDEYLAGSIAERDLERVSFLLWQQAQLISDAAAWS